MVCLNTYLQISAVCSKGSQDDFGGRQWGETGMLSVWVSQQVYFLLVYLGSIRVTSHEPSNQRPLFIERRVHVND